MYFEKELGGVLSDNDITPYNMGSMLMPVVNVPKNSNADVVRELKALKSTIKEKEGVAVNIDKNGFSTFTTSQGGKKERLNNVLTLKSKVV